MKKILAICIFTLVVVNAFCQDLNKIIGKTFRNIDELPELLEYRDGGGAVIQDNYVIKSLSKGNERLIILARIVKINGKVNYNALDFFTEKVGSREQFIAYQMCRRNRQTNDRIIAKVIYEDKEYFDNILKAWLVNMDTLKIEPTTVDNIDCSNEGWGI